MKHYSNIYSFLTFLHGSIHLLGPRANIMMELKAVGSGDSKFGGTHEEVCVWEAEGGWILSVQQLTPGFLPSPTNERVLDRHCPPWVAAPMDSSSPCPHAQPQ